eukprot:2043837-Pyramimonas_sp.AAC.1
MSWCTRAVSSAHARSVLPGTLRDIRRNKMSAATAMSSGDSGQPWRTPRVIAKPCRRAPPMANSQ